LDPFIAALIFLAGLACGSFLNVCISRIPNEVSIIAPRSCCPLCGSAIRWRDNIPLLSWVRLRGRCRDCGRPISLRYPFVELLTAVLLVACYGWFGLTLTMAKGCVFCFLIVGLIFMDAETGLLPAEFTYPGIVLGLLFAWFVPVDASGTKLVFWLAGRPAPVSPPALSLMDAAAGVVFGAGFFLVAWGAYYAVRRRDGIGFGDIALIAMVGAFLGLKLTVLVVFLSPILGTGCVLVWIVLRRRRTAREQRGDANQSEAANLLLMTPIPFGVFLGSSALIAQFFGGGIWDWYLGLFR